MTRNWRGRRPKTAGNQAKTLARTEKTASQRYSFDGNDPSGCGWPEFEQGNPSVCSANDGIPDEWKQAHGLPLADPNAANSVNAEGYAELEVYLISLAEH